MSRPPLSATVSLRQWNGKAVAIAFRIAGTEAINATMEEAVEIAQDFTPVRTGTLQKSIRILQKASSTGTGGLAGQWGTDVPYAIWVEIGARGKSGVHMLQRAADIAYPQLKEKMRRMVRVYRA
jgi:hypothetical protein